MKKLLVLLFILTCTQIAYAAPVFRIERTILPETTSAYELGTTTKKWLRLFTDYASTTAVSATTICLTGDTCRTTWPSSSGSSGGGTNSVATSSQETSTYIPFWTSTNATPATLSGGNSLFTWNNTIGRLIFPYASTTYISGSTASTSALVASNSATFSFLGTGLAKITSGVLGLATAGSDYLTNDFKDWQISGGFLRPTTTIGVIINASSTIGNGTQTGGLTINGGATTTGTHTATSYLGYGGGLTMDNVGSPTIKYLQDFFNLYSAGVKTGGVITDNGNQTVSVSAGEGTIATGPSATAPLVFAAWAASSTIAVDANDILYIGVEYNGGSPRITHRQTDNFSYQDDFPLGTVSRDGGTLHITQNGRVIADTPGQLIRRFHQTLPYARDELVGGLILGETGTRNVTLSTGYLWDRSNRQLIPAFSTAGADTFDAYYRDGGSGFTKVASQTQWDNTQYDNGTGVLATLGTNKYANQWWYLEWDGGIVMLYGRTQYNNVADALAGTAPTTLPTRLEFGARLIARTVFKKSDNTWSQNATVWTASVLGNTGITNHAQLSNLDFASAGHTGVLPIANGGTNASSLTTTNPLWFDGTRFAASSTPTASYFIATSTTNASTFPYASTTALTVGGSGSALIVPNGNVGIGTTSPYVSLGVAGTTTAAGFVATSSSYYINELDVTPEVRSVLATPPYHHAAAFIDNTVDFGGSSHFASTTASFMFFELKHRIKVNQMSTYFITGNGVGTSTLDIGIYTEGGILLGQATTDWIQQKNTNNYATTTATLSSTLSLAPGNYYIGYLVNATSTATENGTGINPMGWSWNNEGGEQLVLTNILNKHKYFGTTTVATPGTLPNTFNPLTLNWTKLTNESASFGLFVRLDN